MSHKVHPKILKLREVKDWLSRGFYHKNFPQYLKEDFVIRKFLKEKLFQAAIQSIEIERSPNRLKVIIQTARPALVIGRGGKGVEELKRALEKQLGSKDIRLEILEVRIPWASAELVGQWVVSQIQKMVPYRRVLKMALGKVMEQKEVKGARIQVAGRLNGIEISRTEWLQEGKLPRQTFRAVIDYSLCEAHCTYGVIGVKVWLYKGEKFD